MKISKQARRDAKHLFRLCVVEGVLDENRVRQAAAKVAQVKPRGFAGILSHFHRLVKLGLERRTAVVESAAPLPAELQTEVAGQLAWIYGGGLNLSFVQNPALLGGMRIKVGS